MFMAITIGYSLILTVNSMTSGAMETVKNKAARYFSGHISITGYNAGYPVLEESQDIIDTINDTELPIRTISQRTVYYRSDASLFFNGDSISQRRLIGIDFSREYYELSELDFLEGSVDELLKNQNTPGIIISDIAAGILGAKIGDDVSLYMTTDSGQYNSTSLIVRGIFRETSLFGYVAYINRKDLNLLMQKDVDFATDIALYTEKGSNPAKISKKIERLLSKTNTILTIAKKKDLSARLSEYREGEQVLALLTLDVHLDQIKTIMDAINIVTWVIQVLFMLLVMVGILNTYRVLVFERTKEIGALRAMGMTQKEVRFLFLFEASFLDISASFIGFIVFRGLILIIRHIDMSKIPGSGLFTDKSNLLPFIELKYLIVTAILMLSAVLIAAWSPSSSASRLSPVDAMREEN